MGNLIYTLLTSCIIILGKARDRFCNRKSKTAKLRIDRPGPWCHEWGDDMIFMGCCDCGLAHFVISGHSFTPVRTAKYAYKFRFGAKAWTEPDPDLGEHVLEKAREAGVVE